MTTLAEVKAMVDQLEVDGIPVSLESAKRFEIWLKAIAWLEAIEARAARPRRETRRVWWSRKPSTTA